MKVLIEKENFKVELLEIAGIASCVQSLELSRNRDRRSETDFAFLEKDEDNGETFIPTLYTQSVSKINRKDWELMYTLVKKGDEHAKPLRGVTAWLKITAPVYWWCEMETYRHGHERLMSESTMFQEGRKLKGDELRAAKARIPMGRTLTKIDMFSYQCLRRIYNQRKTHRLLEWQWFCKCLNELPLYQLILNDLPLNQLITE